MKNWIKFVGYLKLVGGWINFVAFLFEAKHQYIKYNYNPAYLS
jgi:hypothetical protein